MKDKLILIFVLLLATACSANIKKERNIEKENRYSKIANVNEESTSCINNSVSPSVKNEIIVFCDLFASAIQSRNMAEIKNVIRFPIWVECFKDRSRGDTINQDDFLQYQELVFDSLFFKEIRDFNRELTLYDTLSKKRDSDISEKHFILSVPYLYQEDFEEETYFFEKNRLFRFEKDDDSYKLVLVFCAG